MKDLDKHKKIAVLIDADNTQYSKLKLILDEISGHGHILTKKAYGDWSNEHLKNWKDMLNELAVEPVQQFAYTPGKNATDISMIIEAMDLLYTKKYDAFALVSSDSDFTKLASRLRVSEVFVFGVGEAKTPQSFRNACDDFILIENLGQQPKQQAEPKTEPQKNVQQQSQNAKKIKSELGLLFTHAWEKCQDDDGWAGMGPVGNFVKRLRPDFDPRTYGETKLTDVIAKLGNFEVKKTKSMTAYRPKKTATR